MGDVKKKTQCEAGETAQLLTALEDQGAATLAVGDRVENMELNWDMIRVEVEQLQSEIRAVRETVLPPKCVSRNGRVHWVASLFRTACHWEWTANGGTVTDAETPITCKRCLKVRA